MPPGDRPRFRPDPGPRSRPSLLLIVVLAALSETVATAQAQVIGPFTMRAVKTAAPPAIDGVVDTDEWRDAARVADFIQFEPNRGEPSELGTEVAVLYDDTHLYVAFEALDPEPLLAQMTQRDAELWNDDSVQIYIDTFHDGRSGYFFMANVLGTQLDGRLAEDGTTNDDTWDAPWVSATRQTESGYTVEVSIPLNALQYAAGDNTTWGINFARSRRRTLERSYWSGPLDHWGRMSQAGDLVGLDLPPPARRHQVIPYALSQAQQGRSPDASLGLDARYALTPQTSAYATLNPDFATIEADQEEINLTRFELNLTEKRQFFIEGQELFRQRIRTFYSRRIGDISGGAKVLGTQGGWSFAALSTQGDLQGSSDGANYTVARVRRDVASRSNIGFLLANRSHEGRNRGAVEIDANLFFTQLFGFTGQFVKSYGAFGRGSVAFFARPSYDSSTAHAHIRYTHLGDRFADNVNAVGFIRDDDRRELDGAVAKTVFVRDGAVERVAYNSNYNVYWGQTRTLRSWQVDESLAVDWRNRWSTTVNHTEEFKLFEKDFRNRQTGVEIGYNTRSYESISGGYTFGRNFEADFKLWAGAVIYTLTEELSAEYELQRLELDPDPNDESTWIHVIRANQFFTPDLFLRVFFQTNSAIDRRNVQAVFVYRYLPPFGTIQVAYQRGTAEFGERSNQGNTLFIKLTTVL
ncbi:MAG: hypothetical protein CL477_05625 [Acidobacteria bacterium]|nr:hypothetical protein [Acidobacteriota bacterium]